MFSLNKGKNDNNNPFVPVLVFWIGIISSVVFFLNGMEYSELAKSISKFNFSKILI